MDVETKRDVTEQQVSTDEEQLQKQSNLSSNALPLVLNESTTPIPSTHENAEVTIDDSPVTENKSSVINDLTVTKNNMQLLDEPNVTNFEKTQTTESLLDITSTESNTEVDDNTYGNDQNSEVQDSKLDSPADNIAIEIISDPVTDDAIEFVAVETEKSSIKKTIPEKNENMTKNISDLENSNHPTSPSSFIESATIPDSPQRKTVLIENSMNKSDPKSNNLKLSITSDDSLTPVLNESIISIPFTHEEVTDDLKRPMSDELIDGPNLKTPRLSDNGTEDQPEVTILNHKNQLVDLMIGKMDQIVGSINSKNDDKKPMNSDDTHDVNNELKTSFDMINHNGNNEMGDNVGKEDSPNKEGISNKKENKKSSTKIISNDCEFIENSKETIINDKKEFVENGVTTTKPVSDLKMSSSSDNLDHENAAVTIDDSPVTENDTQLMDVQNVIKTEATQTKESHLVIKSSETSTEVDDNTVGNGQDSEVLDSAAAISDIVIEISDSDTDDDDIEFVKVESGKSIPEKKDNLLKSISDSENSNHPTSSLNNIESATITDSPQRKTVLIEDYMNESDPKSNDLKLSITSDDERPQVLNESTTSIPSTDEPKNGSKRCMSDEPMEGHKIKTIKLSEDGIIDQL